MRRWGFTAFLSLGLVAGGACSAEETTEGPAKPTETFATSSCGTCVLAVCEAEVTACGADPGCAAYLECLEDCSLGALGDADATCEAACPRTGSSTSTDLVAALSLCRDDQGVVECEACGFASLLEQECPNPPTESEECPRCEEERCCDTRQACRDVPECVPFLHCLQACPVGAEEIACTQQCAIDLEPGIAAFAEKFACIIGNCNAECGDACSGCIAANCPNTHMACQADLSCYLLDKCFASCDGDATCASACLDTYPEGNELFTASSICLLESCGVECGG